MTALRPSKSPLPGPLPAGEGAKEKVQTVTGTEGSVFLRRVGRGEGTAFGCAAGFGGVSPFDRRTLMAEASSRSLMWAA